MYSIIKKFLESGGKCLLIENNKPVGVILTVEEYELLQDAIEEKEIADNDPEVRQEFSFTPAPVVPAPVEKTSANPIGEAIAEEIDYPEVSAELSDIEAVDDITLDDLGIDESSY